MPLYCRVRASKCILIFFEALWLLDSAVSLVASRISRSPVRSPIIDCPGYAYLAIWYRISADSTGSLTILLLSRFAVRNGIFRLLDLLRLLSISHSDVFNDAWLWYQCRCGRERFDLRTFIVHRIAIRSGSIKSADLWLFTYRWRGGVSYGYIVHLAGWHGGMSRSCAGAERNLRCETDVRMTFEESYTNIIERMHLEIP